MKETVQNIAKMIPVFVKFSIRTIIFMKIIKHIIKKNYLDCLNFFLIRDVMGFSASFPFDVPMFGKVTMSYLDRFKIRLSIASEIHLISNILLQTCIYSYGLTIKGSYF